MILNELKKTFKGRLIGTQWCSISCDTCLKSFQRVLNIRTKSFKKYKCDLCTSCSMKLQYAEGLRDAQRASLIKLNTEKKGKTSEEIRGVERTLKMKSKMSIKSAGEKNPNFGGRYSKWEGGHKWIRERKGQSLEQKYGEERGSKIRQKRSENSSGKNNGMYGKPSPQGSGNGWSGWFNGFFFRSLLELSYLKFCVDAGIKIQSAESVKYKVKYSTGGVSRTYFPDYYLQDTDEIVEVKPMKLSKSKDNIAKFEAAKHKYGEKFKIITEQDIQRLSTQEISEMRRIGVLKFINRYEQKFKEKYEDKVSSI